MKAIKINSETMSIEVMDVENSLQGIYQAVSTSNVNVTCIDRFYIGNHVCYVDDEGLFNPHHRGFRFGGHTILGNGIIFNTLNPDGVQDGEDYPALDDLLIELYEKVEFGKLKYR